jgi:hypothetical protein
MQHTRGRASAPMPQHALAAAARCSKAPCEQHVTQGGHGSTTAVDLLFPTSCTRDPRSHTKSRDLETFGVRLHRPRFAFTVAGPASMTLQATAVGVLRSRTCSRCLQCVPVPVLLPPASGKFQTPHLQVNLLTAQQYADWSGRISRGSNAHECMSKRLKCTGVHEQYDSSKHLGQRSPQVFLWAGPVSVVPSRGCGNFDQRH